MSNDIEGDVPGVLLPHLQVHGYRGKVIQFSVSRGKVHPGRTTEAVLHWAGHHPKARIYVNRFSVAGPLSAQLLWPAELVSALERAFPEPERRDSPRRALELPVRCLDIPGNLAFTRDISSCGVRLVTEGPVAVGRVLPLSIEVAACQPLLLRGEVRWCRPTRAGYELGARFSDVEPSTRATLALCLRRSDLGVSAQGGLG